MFGDGGVEDVRRSSFQDRPAAAVGGIGSGGQITEIIDATGDGAGNPLSFPWGIAVDGSGNVYVTGELSHNAFQITPHLCADGFESGDTLDWSASLP